MATLDYTDLKNFMQLMHYNSFSMHDKYDKINLQKDIYAEGYSSEMQPHIFLRSHVIIAQLVIHVFQDCTLLCKTLTSQLSLNGVAMCLFCQYSLLSFILVWFQYMHVYFICKCKNNLI